MLVCDYVGADISGHLNGTTGRDGTGLRFERDGARPVSFNFERDGIGGTGIERDGTVRWRIERNGTTRRPVTGPKQSVPYEKYGTSRPVERDNPVPLNGTGPSRL